MKTGDGLTLYPWQKQKRKRGVCPARTYYLGKLSRCSYTRIIRVTNPQGEVIVHKTTCCGCFVEKKQ